MKKILKGKSTDNPNDIKKHSMNSLKKMATTKELKNVFKKIENETIPTVRNAWIEYFFEIRKQPKYK